MIRPPSLLSVLALVVILSVACTQTDRSRTQASPETVQMSSSDCRDLDRLIQRTRRGYVPVRSADILPIPTEPHYIGKADLPVHTGPWDYLAEVPLVFYGPGVIRPQKIDRPVTLADLAPTTAELIGFDFRSPDGSSQRIESARVPKVVVTIVWDGAGWNTLREHRRSWPFLKRAMRRGVSFANTTIGSTPSNTPPIHTTIGTGAFPATHGVPHVKIRDPKEGYIDPYEGDEASSVRVPTLGDVYDRRRGNRPKIGVVATVNWHLGMIGHGAQSRGGDHDTAVLLNDQGLGYGNAAVYDLADQADPSGLSAATERLDVSDGERDGRWDREQLEDPAVRNATPAFTDYQESVLETTIREEGFGADSVPDLMYVNFKAPDDAGHRWGMTSGQVGENLKAVDDALRRLTRFLDRAVGEGEWVVVVTADHGQTPYPEESGAWPIRGSELNADIEQAFEGELDVLRVTSAGIFLSDPDAIETGEAAEVARWMIDYSVADNLPDGQDLPEKWARRGDTRLFSAVMAGRDVVASVCDPRS